MAVLRTPSLDPATDTIHEHHLPTRLSPEALDAQIGGSSGSSASSVAPSTPYPRMARTEWINTFQPGHGATDNFTGGAPGTVDTEDFVMGEQSIHLTTTTGLSSIKLTGLSVDLTGKALTLMVKHTTLPGQLTLYAGAADLSTFWTWNVSTGPTDGLHRSTSGEWEQLTFPIESGWASGVPDRANIGTIMVRTMDSGVSDWHIQGIGTVPVSPKFPNGYCAITFDDGHASALMAARRVMSPRGITGTMFHIPTATDAGWGGYMNEAELNELHRTHMWDIQAHGQDDYTSMTPGELRTEWRATKEWFASRGYPLPDHLAYPYGAFDPEVTEVAREFFTSARTIHSGVEVWPPHLPMQVQGLTGVGSAEGGLPLSFIRDSIDDARQGGHVIVLVFHQITEGAPTEPTQASLADMENILDHALSVGIEVGSYGDLWK